MALALWIVCWIESFHFVFIAVKNGSLLFDSLSVSTVQLTLNSIMP